MRVGTRDFRKELTLSFAVNSLPVDHAPFDPANFSLTAPSGRFFFGELGLGSALRVLGWRESGTGRLEESVAPDRAALLERTRERVPLDWAVTQSNLGSALQALGWRESGTGRLEEAVAAYRAALLEYTRERVPLRWAVSTGSQGVALMLLAERRDDAKMADVAVRQIETAFITMRDSGHAPNAAYYEAQLPQAHALVEHLKRQSASRRSEGGATASDRR